MTNELSLTLVFAAVAVVALGVPSLRRRLSSMRTGVALLAVLALLSVAGVVIGQNLPPTAYTDRFGTAGGALLLRSGLASVFGTWYFMLAVWVLALSILTCSFQRVARLVRAPGRRLARVGSLLTHVSLVVILAGGVVMARYGHRRPDPRFLGAGDTTVVEEGGFSLRVEEARTEFTDDGTISEYVSIVTVIEDGVEHGTHRIEVNHPLVRNGVGVYQYEMMPSAESVDEIVLGVAVDTPGAAGMHELTIPFGEAASVPGTNLTVKPLSFLSHFTYDIESGTAGLASIWHDNPAVLVQVSALESVVSESWLFVGLRGHEGDGDVPLHLFFLGYEPDFGNGLTRFEYSRQPGTPILFTGFAALSLGLCMTFWTRAGRKEPK
ncbi:MAG: cytochrome c biogenesis protein ResB [Candidatus Eisenbacteria bacterium]